MSFGRVINYNISIIPSANNGFIVEVGCGRFVYQSKDELLTDLGRYLANPLDTEKEYNEFCNGHAQEEAPHESQPQTVLGGARGVGVNTTRG